jgi:hypothetical protein
MTTTSRSGRGRRRTTLLPPRYVFSVIGIALAGIFYGGVFALVIDQMLPRVVNTLLPPGTTFMMWEYPGPFAGWLNLWTWLSLLQAAVLTPREVREQWRIRRRSRQLDAFVMWRVHGLFELHHPRGGGPGRGARPGDLAAFR